MSKLKATHPLLWLFDELEKHPHFFRRKMFGLEAGYVNGRLCLVLGAGKEPWNGLLIATSREEHPALLKRHPELASHPVLGKWLYLSQHHRDFEKIAQALVNAVRRGDPRIGVEPKLRKSRKPLD